MYQSGSPDFRLKLDTHTANMCGPLVMDDELPQAMPCRSTDPCQLDLPSNVHPALTQIVNEYSMLFSQQIGRTDITQHFIDTGDSPPVKVPPRPIPFHFVDRVQQKLADMAQEGIIRPNSSPWCAPAVYLPKSIGEIRICVDFFQLNHRTKKDSYPVPRADRPHQCLAGKQILDLRSAYWQFPMHESSNEKTASAQGLDLACGSLWSCRMG